MRVSTVTINTHTRSKQFRVCELEGGLGMRRSGVELPADGCTETIGLQWHAVRFVQFLFNSPFELRSLPWHTFRQNTSLFIGGDQTGLGECFARRYPIGNRSSDINLADETANAATRVSIPPGEKVFPD